MSNTAVRRARRRRARGRRWAIASATAVGLGVVAGIVLVTGPRSSGTDLERTGETNAMGMPVVATPGSARGVASADGVTASPGLWELGRVPLNVAVRPTWELRNTGSDVIALGEPHVQVNEGCCPGALTYTGSATLEPDHTAGLTFELSMHPGMDGAHDMTIHVPVRHADGTSSVLDLAVTGDFRDE